MSLKASIKDVCVLSDSKPSNKWIIIDIDDVNNALKEINLITDELTINGNTKFMGVCKVKDLPFRIVWSL